MKNNNHCYHGFDIDNNNKREKRIYEDFNPFGYNYLNSRNYIIDDYHVYSKTCQFYQNNKQSKNDLKNK